MRALCGAGVRGRPAPPRRCKAPLRRVAAGLERQLERGLRGASACVLLRETAGAGGPGPGPGSGWRRLLDGPDAERVRVLALPAEDAAGRGRPRPRPRPELELELRRQLVGAVREQVERGLRGAERGAETERAAALLRELSLQAGAGAGRGLAGGRQRLAERLCRRLGQDEAGGRAHAPLVLLGPPGCGKTALMGELRRRVRAALRPGAVVVLRRLGAAPLRCSVRGLLAGLCLQVSLALGLPPPPARLTRAYAGALRCFGRLLLAVSRRGSPALVLLLDSVDRLLPAPGARSLRWLPKACPPNVHVLVSLSAAEHGLLQTLREAVPEAEAYFEMGPLSGEEGREMLEGLLASAGRKLSPAQRAVLQHSLPAGGDPLLFQLAFQQVRSWASYTPPSALVISRTVQDALHQLCDTLEKLHGSVLVSRALGYIASSR